MPQLRSAKEATSFGRPISPVKRKPRKTVHLGEFALLTNSHGQNGRTPTQPPPFVEPEPKRATVKPEADPMLLLYQFLTVCILGSVAASAACAVYIRHTHVDLPPPPPPEAVSQGAALVKWLRSLVGQE